ncbi:extensin family protein [Novosphingobium kaempferiae]|uniref:extensin-like domain-containing protein n=1 Tax=Novosphingobium kaempferiae TaxID=2896849 RepID=UPI001E55C5E3|nr:extensin family protein [Novosphingobium kaempferiae]
MPWQKIVRFLVVIALIAVALLFGRAWLGDHPEYDPRAPLTIDQPDTWVTARKFAALRDDRDVCRAFLRRSGITVTALPPLGAVQCRRDDRKILAAPARFDIALRPAGAQGTCAIDAGLARWLHRDVQPAAEAMFGQRVVRLEHLGTANCRRIGGGDTGNWSEHATGNAIDIAAFVLANGRRISVSGDWKKPPSAPEAMFLHAARDSACDSFSTVLSPDYNSAHSDHLHLDQARRSAGWSACR